MELRDYIKTEKFIWDDLIVRAQAAVRDVQERWRKGQVVPRMLVAFPSEHVKADDGRTITDVVSFVIPEKMTTPIAASKLAKATRAYALLLIERIEDRVDVVLESHHGVKRWTMAIVRHGDVKVLADAKGPVDGGPGIREQRQSA